ncbi:MAG: hypothetical protein ACRDL8_21720 [Solirubrobacteraceae bacterium]
MLNALSESDATAVRHAAKIAGIPHIDGPRLLPEHVDRLCEIVRVVRDGAPIETEEVAQ